jgi:ornithine cyclodeaminase
MQIYTKEQIEKAIDIPYLIAEIEKGLILYSKEKAIIAPSSFLHFKTPPGDVHIKSGAIIDEDLYVVKIASGFYDNPKFALSSSNGLMLLFSQKTGELKAILLDEGRLTDLRTGLAGAIAAKHLANHPIIKIGIIGTGIQAREQLFNLQFATDCREVLVWGRNPAKAMDFAQDPRLSISLIF